MRRRIPSLVFAAFFFLPCAGTIWAQEPATTVGIGISMDPTRLFMTGSSIYSNAITPVNLYVPITGQDFRIEPEIGYYSTSYKSSLSGSSAESNASMFHIGLGGFYVITANVPVRMYVGPRIGFNFASSTSSSTTPFGSSSSESTETDFIVGLSFGGEYLCAPQFSIGGEAQVNYISFGQPDVTTTPPPSNTGPSADLTRHLLSSNVLFFFRWFF
jgi:hypothetical protein